MSEEPKSAYSQLMAQQRKFVDAYLGEAKFNAAKAARAAGYSENHINKTGGRVKRHPLVKQAIEEGLDERGLTKFEVLDRLSDHARGEYADFIGDEGTVDLKGLREAGLMHLVKKTSFDRNGNLTVEFHDPQTALVHLGKAHGIFSERIEHSAPGGGPLTIREVIIERPAPDDEDDESEEEPVAD